MITRRVERQRMPGAPDIVLHTPLRRMERDPPGLFRVDAGDHRIDFHGVPGPTRPRCIRGLNGVPGELRELQQALLPTFPPLVYSEYLCISLCITGLLIRGAAVITQGYPSPPRQNVVEIRAVVIYRLLAPTPPRPQRGRWNRVVRPRYTVEGREAGDALVQPRAACWSSGRGIQWGSAGIRGGRRGRHAERLGRVTGATG